MRKIEPVAPAPMERTRNTPIHATFPGIGDLAPSAMRPVTWAIPGQPTPFKPALAQIPLARDDRVRCFEGCCPTPVRRFASA